MKTHFPLAAEMTPPPEVRFYCAAPWNETTFRDFRASLDANGVDLAGLMIRGASPEQRSIMESVAPMALSQADQGPPGMGNIYRAQKVLPLLWAIHNGDGAEVLDQLDPSDLESLRKTQAMVNWEAPAIQGSVGVTTAQVGEQTKLSEIPGIILANDY